MAQDIAHFVTALILSMFESLKNEHMPFKFDGGIFVTVLAATLVGLALHQGVIAPQIAKITKK